MIAAPPPLVLDDVTLGYGGHPAVHHLDGRFAPGALTAICGPNGAGKSTLLKGLAGALPPLGGRIDRGGLRAHDVAYLPQAAQLDWTFPLDVFAMVAMGAVARRGLFRRLGGDRERIAAALDAVGLGGFERRPIGALSGGQMQRLLFARLMLQDAPVILLDEPFAAVDARTLADLMAIVRAWHGQGRTIMAVLHDFELVRRNFPHALLLARDLVAWGPSEAVLTEANLARASALGEAFDEDARHCARAA